MEKKSMAGLFRYSALTCACALAWGLMSCAHTTTSGAESADSKSESKKESSAVSGEEVTTTDLAEDADDDLVDKEKVELQTVLDQGDDKAAPEGEEGDEEATTEQPNVAIGKDVAEDTVSHYDFPIVVNSKVLMWVNYFQTRGRHYFDLYLQRSFRYLPMIRQIFREEGLPDDLSYLAMIESGFSTKAYSHAHAVGHWQFISATGRRYGLNINWWVDERRDPELAARAAAKYLKDLYGMFDSWYLAAAAYNAGENKIARAIQRYRTRNFWELTRHRYLRPETKNYIPKLLAAIIMAKNPEKYGFNTKLRQEPDVVDIVEVTGAVNLAVLSKMIGVSEEYMKEINPALRRPYTPPDTSYAMRVPEGKAELVEKHFPQLAEEEAAKEFVAKARAMASAYRVELDQTRSYTVRRGDSIGKIARRFRVRASTLARANGMRRSTRIYVGQRLRVPTRGGSVDSADSGVTTVLERMDRQPTAAVAGESSSSSASTYKVRHGDTLSVIAKKFRVALQHLMKANRLTMTSRIYVGQLLKLPSGARSVKLGRL